MEGKTPMRVRGKRNASAAEKWHHGKRRKTGKSSSLPLRSSSSLSDSSTFQAHRQRKRKPLNPELSRLEQLPAEVIQLIFVYSGNITLPLASAVLASQLTSRHLHRELTDQILLPVLRPHEPSLTKLKSATRLMNSRFFTLDFFGEWLESQIERPNVTEALKVSPLTPAGSSERSAKPSDDHSVIWEALRPQKDLLPPSKLMRAPFTSDKLDFVFTLYLSVMPVTSWNSDPVWQETAQQSLREAIMMESEGMIEFFGGYTIDEVPVSTELVRLAVVDAGCNRKIVGDLIEKAVGDDVTIGDLDCLDPVLWAWADKASEGGDERGAWLIERLKRAKVEMDGARERRAQEV